MCKFCEDRAEWLELTELRVSVYGWTAVMVGDEPDDPFGWTYTLGLREFFGHPDLIVVDTAPSVGYRLVAELAENVVQLGHVGADFEARGGVVRPIDEHLLADGLVDGWETFSGRLARDGDFLEVELPDGLQRNSRPW